MSLKSKSFRDFSLTFEKNAVTNDVLTLNNEAAIKESVKNIVFYNFYEKPFHPEIGSGVRDMLFENMSPVTAVVLARKVEDVIENFEPRARLVGVRALPNLDRNEYEVTIEFFVVNAPTELVDMTVFLEVLR